MCGEMVEQVAQSRADALSLETFKVKLGGALNHIIELMSLLFAGGLDWVTFKGPFQSSLFCDFQSGRGNITAVWSYLSSQQAACACRQG